MASVVIAWKGACPDRARQDELLAYLGQVAGWHLDMWKLANPEAARGWQALHALRGGQPVAARPLLRQMDDEIAGRILVVPEIAADGEACLAMAAAAGLEIIGDDSGRASDRYIRVDRLQVRGLDYHNFDTRGLYPGEDRAGFFFLGSREAPFLDGHLAAVDGQPFLASLPNETLAAADWVVQAPWLHLRGHLEDWTSKLLAWIRRYFIPDLYYTEVHVDGDASLRPKFETLEALYGRDAARDRYFNGTLRRRFLAEVNANRTFLFP